MFSASFYTQLQELTPWQQTAFIISLSQHSTPNYQLFSEHSGFGNAQKFSCFSDLVWQFLENPKLRVNFELQQEKFELLIPNVEDFDMYGVYPALDSCVLLSCAFNSIIHLGSDDAKNASNTSLSTIVKLLELQEERTLDDSEIKDSELFIMEQQFQEKVLNFITKEVLSKTEMTQLKELARNNDISNIGISL